jgi:glyoxylase I family protein
MIKGIAHVCINTSDLEATERFYTKALGLTRKFAFLKDGNLFGYYLDAGNGGFVEVFGGDGIDTGRRPAMTHVCLEVDDLQATIEAVRNAGVEISDRKMGADNSWQAWVTDPNGIKIELLQYTAESCQFTGNDCIVDW